MVECEVILRGSVAKSMTDESSLDVRPFVSVHERALLSAGHAHCVSVVPLLVPGDLLFAGQDLPTG